MLSAGSPKRPAHASPLTWTTVPPELSRSGRSRSRKTRHRDPDLRVVQRPRELRQRAGLHDRVRVQEDEHVARRLGGAAVAAAREAEVLAGLDEAHPALALRRHDLGSLPPLSTTITSASPHRRERAQAAGERLARLVGDDDDGDGQ